MPSRLKSWQLLAAALLSLPILASASSIQINATCVLGTCPPAAGPGDAVQFGESIGPTTGTFNQLFGNGDLYRVDWTFGAAYDDGGTSVYVVPTVTYIGAGASAGDDVITFHFYQNFYDASPGSWDGNYTENIPLSLSAGAAAGSNVTGQLFYGGQGLGLMGPVGPGASGGGMNTVNLTGLNDSTLTAEFVFTFDFRTGTLPDAVATSTAVPEPAQALPLGLVLAGLAYRMTIRRRRSGMSLQ